MTAMSAEAALASGRAMAAITISFLETCQLAVGPYTTSGVLSIGARPYPSVLPYPSRSRVDGAFVYLLDCYP